ncbi:GTP-binding protein [Nocardia asteroides]|uniref:GTP-binding protein n=1 Tax=Nocardia asteroides TaxID=1824 RepID=UPI001E5DC259|nr:GTP-binding protein [Nocardia asteroides]UGT54194.1 GTP-binding protein [Nocardia asteroides]
MGAAAIDPQTICNVTLIGDPDETARLRRRLRRGGPEPGPIPWSVDGVEHTVHLAELSSRAPVAELERSIRVADGVIALVHAAVRRAPRLESILRMADDHQVARLCLVTGLDHPAADFERCVRTIAGIRGAVPLALHSPRGAGAGFAGVIDVVPMWSLAPMAAEFFGDHWPVAERRYRDLVTAVLEQDVPEPGIRADELVDRIRRLTHIGEAVPVLCDAAPAVDDIAPLLDAIVRYLPSPMHVWQPEHSFDC